MRLIRRNQQPTLTKVILVEEWVLTQPGVAIMKDFDPPAVDKDGNVNDLVQ